MLKGKSRGTTSWLPSQVLYGIDTSDSDPENWKPFGQFVDEENAAKAASQQAAASKSAPPLQSRPAGQ